VSRPTVIVMIVPSRLNQIKDTSIGGFTAVKAPF
jgi:hypothetical protein